MTAKTKKVLETALELTHRQRAELAASLFRSLNLDEIDDPNDVEKAWSQEIKRRIKEVDEGTVDLIPWEDVKRKLRSIRNGHKD